ncbi:hypothetical protein Chor_005083 [Crotalus horridus]
MDLLPKSKYTHLQDESPPSLDDGTPVSEGFPSPDPTPLLTGSLSSSSLSPMLPVGDPESEASPTTLCSFFPKMANLKLSHPASLLNLRAFSRETGVPEDSPGGAASASSDSTGVVGLYPQDMNKLSCGKKMRVEGGQLGGEEWTRHGSFVNKPSRGWLHRDDKVMGSGVSYLVRFAAMPITLTISTSSLNLMASDCKQDTAEYVAYVAKDPVNHREPFEDALRAPLPPATPPSHPPASMEEQLRREPWYHGQMSRKESEKLLQANGDFLVRESTTTPGQYVLTGLQGGQPKHLLLVDPEGVVRTKDHRFESVSHLISHHMDNRLPIISAGSELCLQQPVERRP